MKNQFTVTKEMYKSWCIDSQFRGRRLAFFIMWCVLFGVCMGLAIWSREILFVIYAIFCGYQAFARVFVLANVNYRRIAKSYNCDNWVRTIEFLDDKIMLSEESFSMTFTYDSIVKFVDKDNRIWIYFNNKTCIRMYKDAFVSGNWEQCKRFLEENNRWKILCSEPGKIAT